MTKVTRPGVLRVHDLGGARSASSTEASAATILTACSACPGDGSRTVRVHRHQLGWIAVNPKGHLIDRGTVRKIRLPRGGQPAAPTEQLGPRTLESWRSVSR